MGQKLPSESKKNEFFSKTQKLHQNYPEFEPKTQKFDLKVQKLDSKAQKLDLKAQKLDFSAFQLSGVGWICAQKKSLAEKDQFKR